jgi:hypothetical protein
VSYWLDRCEFKANNYGSNDIHINILAQAFHGVHTCMRDACAGLGVACRLGPAACVATQGTPRKGLHARRGWSGARLWSTLDT